MKPSDLKVVFGCLACLLIGMVLGALFTLIPNVMLKEGTYQLVLPNQGAIVVKDPRIPESTKFIRIPAETINFVVDESRAWEVVVKTQGFYRMVSIYVPSKDFLPESQKSAIEKESRPKEN